MEASSLGHSLAVGQKKEGELETKSLEFEYLHHKSRCEMLIGGATISNDVITLAACRVNVCLQVIRARFCFTLIGQNLIA